MESWSSQNEICGKMLEKWALRILVLFAVALLAGLLALGFSGFGVIAVYLFASAIILLVIAAILLGMSAINKLNEELRKQSEF